MLFREPFLLHIIVEEHIMTLQALRMLEYLRRIADGLRETHSDGTVWAQVCTVNITIPGIAKNQNAGYLSGLYRAGLYRKVDKYSGMVLLSREERNIS